MTDLATRYGRPSRTQRRVVLGIAGAVSAVLVVLVLWGYVAQADPEVQSRLTRFEVESEHETVAYLTVVREDQDVVATCTLQALASDHSQVGEAVETVDSGPAKQTFRIVIRTERRATSVDPLGCTTRDQARPR